MSGLHLNGGRAGFGGNHEQSTESAASKAMVTS